MKIIIRIYGIIIIFLFFLVFDLYLLKASIISNELDNALKIAIEQSQDVMKEIIYQRNNNQQTSFTDEEYQQHFCNSFNSLVKDPSIYSLNINVNSDYGILSIEARTSNVFVKKRSLTNIVDVLLIDSKEKEEEIKIANFYGDAHSDNVIYEKEFAQAKTLTKLNLYAISYMNSDESKYYDCSPEINVYLDDSLVKSFEHVRKREMRTIEFPEGTKAKKIKIITKALDWDYYDRKQVLVVGNSKIGIITKEEIYKIYNRYIADVKSLDINSIWNMEGYSQMLYDYLN